MFLDYFYRLISKLIFLKKKNIYLYIFLNKKYFFKKTANQLLNIPFNIMGSVRDIFTCWHKKSLPSG
jgi:hypothetical protein